MTLIDFRDHYATRVIDFTPADPADVQVAQDAIDRITIKRWRDKEDARAKAWQANADQAAGEGKS